jgi:hypothetical protein
MNWINRMYMLVLRLYPRPFRERFGEEMAGVFGMAVEEARARGGLGSFLLRELARLPASLIGEYVYAFRTQGAGGLAFSGAGGGDGSFNANSAGGASPGWGAALLAGLPHLLLGLLASGGGLLNALAPEVGKAFTRLLWLPLLALGLACAVVLVYNLRAGWKNWSASWLLYIIFIPLLAVLSQVSSASDSRGVLGTISWILDFVITPFAMAYVLYKLACANAKRGLLASIPMSVIFWAFFEEFVPELLRGLAWLWIFGLAFVAAALILRSRRPGVSLALALMVPVLGGLPFAYLGVYHGGTLSYSEPGPSPRVVIEQYVPFLAAMCSMILGPQIGARLRALGRASAAEGGNAASRLALGGILAAMTLLLFYFGRTINAPNLLSYTLTQTWLMKAVAAIVALVYLAGIAWLVWALIRSGALSGEQDAELSVTLLTTLAPGIPLSSLACITTFIGGPEIHSALLLAALALWIIAAAWAAARPGLSADKSPA